MDNEEKDLHVEDAPTIENPAVEETTQEEDAEETVTIPKEKYDAIRFKAKQYDDAIKAKNRTPQPKKEEITNTLSREEALLIAKGYDEEALERLNKVAKATGLQLVEAQKDDMFIAWQEKREAEKKAEQARLGASKGSATVTGKASFSNPNLSAEEHKRLWKESMSK